MRGKILFITGGFVGYVLGARAGRKRYDQIAAAANDLWNAQPVQRRVTEVRDAALELVGDVPATLFKAGKKAVKKAATKKQATPASTATSAPVPARSAAAAKPKPRATPKATTKATPKATPAADAADSQ